MSDAFGKMDFFLLNFTTVSRVAHPLDVTRPPAGPGRDARVDDETADARVARRRTVRTDGDFGVDVDGVGGFVGASGREEREQRFVSCFASTGVWKRRGRWER